MNKNGINYLYNIPYLYGYLLLTNINSIPQCSQNKDGICIFQGMNKTSKMVIIFKMLIMQIFIQ